MQAIPMQTSLPTDSSLWLYAFHMSLTSECSQSVAEVWQFFLVVCCATDYLTQRHIVNAAGHTIDSPKSDVLSVLHRAIGHLPAAAHCQ